MRFTSDGVRVSCLDLQLFLRPQMVSERINVCLSYKKRNRRDVINVRRSLCKMPFIFLSLKNQNVWRNLNKTKLEFLGKYVKYDLSMQTNGHEGANSHSLYCWGTHLNVSWIMRGFVKDWNGLGCDLMACLVNTLTKIVGNFLNSRAAVYSRR